MTKSPGFSGEIGKVDDMRERKVSMSMYRIDEFLA